MGVGEYLGEKSAREVVQSTIARERREMIETPEAEFAEQVAYYRLKGFTGDEALTIVNRLAKNPDIWLHEMVRDEFGIDLREAESGGLRASLAMAGSFAAGRVLPVLPYVFPLRLGDAMWVALLVAAVALFGIGIFAALMIYNATRSPRASRSLRSARWYSASPGLRVITSRRSSGTHRSASGARTRAVHLPFTRMVHDERPMISSELAAIDAYWRAANYLSVGQIYLLANPLLREPLRLEHLKPRLLGHWGTTPGLNLMYVHLNRAIVARDLDAIFVAGPGHGGPAVVANAYLEGTYTRALSGTSRATSAGCSGSSGSFRSRAAFRATRRRETPGSIHEGGELGYALAHAFGAVFDNPDLLVACAVGDGEAETGPLATSWHGNKFLNPARDGAVLPILHLNGWKIAEPRSARAHPAGRARGAAARLRLGTALRRRQRSGARPSRRTPRRSMRARSYRRDPARRAHATVSNAGRRGR